MMERYPDKVIIYIKKNMEEDWKRFAAVKELCHVVNDENEDWSIDGTGTIRALLAEHHICSEKIAKDIVQSETFAEIAAIELLYPFKDRVVDLDSINGGGLSTSKIAGHYKIPEKMVSQALSEFYHKTVESLWKSIK
jgi:Zn-dependent peptidase ImmA (M78 family)